MEVKSSNFYFHEKNICSISFFTEKFLVGTGQIGYIMLLFNVCLTLVGKGIILGSGVNPELAKSYASKLVRHPFPVTLPMSILREITFPII